MKKIIFIIIMVLFTISIAFGENLPTIRINDNIGEYLAKADIQDELVSSNTDTPIQYITGVNNKPFDTDSILSGWTFVPIYPNNWNVDSTYSSVWLTWSPQVINYDMSVISPELVLPQNSDSLIDLTINMYIDDYSTDMGEIMEIWIIHNGLEKLIFEWDLDIHDDWGVLGGQDWVYTDTGQFAGETVQLKFRSHGGDTFYFNYWFVYHINWLLYYLPPAYGSLHGTVTDAGTGIPLEGVIVTAEPAKYITITDYLGYYMFEDIPVGVYDLTFELGAGYYNVGTVTGIEVLEDQTTTVNYQMTAPHLTFDPDNLLFDINELGAVDTDTLDISNIGTGPVDFTIDIDYVTEHKQDILFICKNRSVSSISQWLSIDMMSGTVAPSTTLEISVTVDTEGLDWGDYYANIIFNTSNPDIGQTIIPVHLDLHPESITETPISVTMLNNNFPNPFKNITTISFSLKEKSNVKLTVYNMKGQLVATLINEEMSSSANNEIIWNGKNGNSMLANGIYFYKLETKDKSFVKRMILLR